MQPRPAGRLIARLDVGTSLRVAPFQSVTSDAGNPLYIFLSQNYVRERVDVGDGQAVKHEPDELHSRAGVTLIHLAGTGRGGSDAEVESGAQHVALWPVHRAGHGTGPDVPCARHDPSFLDECRSLPPLVGVMWLSVPSTSSAPHPPPFERLSL